VDEDVHRERWHQTCCWHYPKNRQRMKKTHQILKPRARLSLGDLILTVSSCTESTKETVATVADLLASGQVRVQNNGRFMRARDC
jgi:S-adenosylmethionine:tRNA-ribosyltransferase-isomerase (queuine synthetase)